MAASPSPQLHSLWAKSRNDGEARHPLLWHLLDVAAMAEVMWSSYASEAFRRQFQLAFALSTPAQAKGWFAWLAAVHDLGKVSPFFQGQVARLAAQASEQGLEVGGRELAHEDIGAALLRDYLLSCGVARPVAISWASAANIAHGTVLSGPQISHAAAKSKTREYGNYAAAVSDVISLVREVVGATEDLGGAVEAQTTLLAEAAGIIKAADWIASDDKGFPYCDESMDAHEYMKRARRHATKAMWSKWLLGWRMPSTSLSFVEQFGIETPRPVQVEADALARDLPLASITIIEAPMGVGKTEAALAMAHQFARKGATGLFFALPTQATARTMHARVAMWLKRTGLSSKDPILNAGDWRIKPPADLDHVDQFSSPDEDGQDPVARTEPSYWFRGAHRALLAKVGVGTVDQILLSAQPVRYGVVRWAGLAGRVVIFDEVHAYDAFMNVLFERALQWLARMGCPVIILSATLPAQTRQKMVTAYRSGLLGHEDDTPVTSATSYPSITTGTVDGITTTHPAGPPDHPVRVEHLLVGENDPATEISKEVVRRASGNVGVVGVICNTVARAVEIARTLRLSLPEAEVEVLHARFTARDRARQTGKVLHIAGEDGLTARHQRLRIIVATQVIEQSIDIDLDWLITEIAPIDLVLQRAGRLHRWGKTKRPEWARDPLLTVCSPAHDTEGLPDLSQTSYIYNLKMPGVMLASWAALRGLDEVIIPADLPRLVEQVYGGHTPSLSADGVARWRELVAEDKHNVGQSAKSAEALLLPVPWGPAHSTWHRLEGGKPLEEGGRYRSRDSDEDSRLVALAYRADDGSLQPASSDSIIPLGNQMEWRYSALPVSGATLRAMGALELKAEWEKGILRDVPVYVLNDGRARLIYSGSEGLEKVETEEM